MIYSIAAAVIAIVAFAIGVSVGSKSVEFDYKRGHDDGYEKAVKDLRFQFKAATEREGNNHE